MKRKRLFLTAVLCLNLLWVYSQSNPNNEILVFFNEGVSQKIKMKNGKKIKIADIYQSKLKSSFEQIGLIDSLIHVALPKFEKTDTLKVSKSGKKIKLADMTKLFRVVVPKGKNRQDIIDYLNTLPQVLFAEPNGQSAPCATPNDTQFNYQWGLNNTTTPGADIHAKAAWDIFTGNPNSIIAIMDNGVDINHRDLDSKIVGGDIGFINGHGTNVAGIAAAETYNNQDVAGVDWAAKIYCGTTVGNDDADKYQAIIDAVDFSENVHVLNNSWSLMENYIPGRNSTVVRMAFAYAYKANRTSIVSMGNHQVTLPNLVQYPAGYENVIAVGATDNTDLILNISVQGNHIDVCAPGLGIFTTDINGSYTITGGGTSYAAPFVSGIASLLKGYNDNLANDDIENIIKLSADDKGIAGFDNAYGYGRVNAEQALLYLQEPYTVAQNSISGGYISSSASQEITNLYGVSGLSEDLIL